MACTCSFGSALLQRRASSWLRLEVHHCSLAREASDVAATCLLLAQAAVGKTAERAEQAGQAILALLRALRDSLSGLPVSEGALASEVPAKHCGRR